MTKIRRSNGWTNDPTEETSEGLTYEKLVRATEALNSGAMPLRMVKMEFGLQHVQELIRRNLLDSRSFDRVLMDGPITCYGVRYEIVDELEHIRVHYSDGSIEELRD